MQCLPHFKISRITWKKPNPFTIWGVFATARHPREESVELPLTSHSTVFSSAAVCPFPHHRVSWDKSAWPEASSWGWRKCKQWVAKVISPCFSHLFVFSLFLYFLKSTFPFYFKTSKSSFLSHHLFFVGIILVCFLMIILNVSEYQFICKKYLSTLAWCSTDSFLLWKGLDEITSSK